MKIAVVGGGIFGVTAATALSQAGFRVDLFERYNDILQAASGINQYRLHRGYHYPRSPETIISSMEAEALFRDQFREAIIDDNDHYYCIASEKSLVSADQYQQVCRTHGLEFESADLPLVNPDAIALCVKVKEALFDPNKLREICRRDLTTSGVAVHCGREVVEIDLEGYDYIVLCAYAHANALLGHRPELQKDYQFELCEKPVVMLPENFWRKSIVILDGPFTCVDPYGRSPWHVIGNVVHAIHASNIGKHPEIPEQFQSLLNRGIIPKPTISNFNLFINSAKHFLPDIVHAKHLGSMFTIRTVLPNLDKTDARPTLVEAIDERIINVFSGKIGNAVVASLEVLSLIKQLSR